MKRKIIIIAIVCAVLLLALYALVQSNNSDHEAIKSEEFQTSDTLTPPSSRQGAGVATLSYLAEANENLECAVTYKPTEAETEVQGTYFIADGAVRGDFLQEDDSLGQIVTSYIAKDGEIYLWSIIGGTSYGVKSTANVSTPLAVKIPIPDEEKVRYNCKAWLVVDGSVFEPPKNILFKDAVNADMEYGTVYEDGEF